MKKVIAFLIFVGGLQFGNWVVALFGFLAYEAMCRFWVASVMESSSDDQGPMN